MTGRRSRLLAVEPTQELLDAPRGERDARVRGAVVEVERIAIGADRVPARKGDVADVAGSLVGCLGAKDPGVAASDAMVRMFEIEQRKTEPVQAAASRLSDPVIEHQPSP